MSRLVANVSVLLWSFLGTGAPRRVLNRVHDGQELLRLSPVSLVEYPAVLQIRARSLRRESQPTADRRILA